MTDIPKETSTTPPYQGKLEPSENERKAIEETIKSDVETLVYNKDTIGDKATKMSEKILDQIKSIRLLEISYMAFKIGVQVVLGENAGQGIRVCSKSLWDVQNDSYAQYEYRNEKIFCVVLVFGYYHE